MESKTNFIKEQLALKGIYDYTDTDLFRLKCLYIDNISLFKMDKYTAFDKAFNAVFKEKTNVESER